jgi:hypothetical protein
LRSHQDSFLAFISETLPQWTHYPKLQVEIFKGKQRGTAGGLSQQNKHHDKSLKRRERWGISLFSRIFFSKTSLQGICFLQKSKNQSFSGFGDISKYRLFFGG